MIGNSLNLNNLEHNQQLFLLWYSNLEHPKFFLVRFTGFYKKWLLYVNEETEKKKKMNQTAAPNRLFVDVDEMARALYVGFQKRNTVAIPQKYQLLWQNSLESRPELWI